MKTILAFLLFTSMNGFAKKPTPEMQKVITELEKGTPKPFDKLTTVDEVRLRPSPQSVAEELGKKRGTLEKVSTVEISDIEIDGALSAIPARLYKPAGEGPLPIVIYFHGGGWVIGKNEDYDATLKSLASKTGAIFLSPGYRKAPEYKFPAAHDDAYAAYLWVLRHGSKIGADPKKVAVAGESAGGNLALNVSIRARDEKQQMPIHQLIIYPIAGTDTKTVSYIENPDATPLNTAKMQWFFRNYLRSVEDLKDKRMNLVEADLKKLPTTTIITAEIDPLRSEGKKLANRLEAQGNDVIYRDYRGVTHDFFSMAPALNDAKQAQEEAAEEMKKTFKQ